MSLNAFFLVLIAACLHATWNLLAKRAEAGASFVFLYSVFSFLIYAPFVVALYRSEVAGLNRIQLAAIGASAIAHLAYSLMLQRAYSIGDFSIVYPVARGTGPFLSTIGAILLLGERPTGVAIAGAVSIVCGVFLLAGGRRIFSAAHASTGVAHGIATGVLISTYTLIDARSVAVLAIPPLVLDATNNMIRALLLVPHVSGRWSEVRAVWKASKLPIFGVAILGPLGYIIVLHVVCYTPVSYVAPMREVSMLLAAVFGATLLKEKNFRERLLAAAMIAGGVAALALG